MAKVDKRPHAGPQQPGKADRKDDKKKAEDKPQAKDAPKPIGWLGDFEAADKNQDGKLTKSELRLAKKFDGDKDGKVTRQEYRAGYHKANAFATLDRDDDGALDEKEMGKLDRFTDAAYDSDGDGSVSEAEFLKNRRAERAAVREARRDEAYEALGAKDKKALKRYDSDEDGQISREEFGAGLVQARAAKAEKKIAALYEQADAKRYKVYDADGDGAVSREEFTAGQKVDRREYWNQVITDGGANKLIARRLDLNAAGFGLNRLQGAPGAPGPQGSDAEGPTDLVISSFNVLGSSHTRAGGNKPGYASGPERMRTAVELLKQHKVDIVGFQEFQPDQVKAFNKLVGDKYDLYPGMKLGRGPNVNSIAWDKKKWDLVKADTIPIPYFNGHPVKMPIVKLRNKETGQEAYFTNFHNPASTKNHPGNEKWRDVATAKQIDMVQRLRKSGLPVFITGDMNERDEYLNKMTRQTEMHASNANKPKTHGIDWIFGSRDVKFTRHVRDKGAKVRRTTDHPMVVSHATIKQ